MSVGEFKTHFSEVVEQIGPDEKIALTFGKKKEIVGYFTPETKKPSKVKLGILQGKASFTFNPDFEMTTEELLGL